MDRCDSLRVTDQLTSFPLLIGTQKHCYAYSILNFSDTHENLSGFLVGKMKK